MAMSSHPRATPRDAHCEDCEGTVGHPHHSCRAGLIPSHRDALRQDLQDRPPGRRATRPTTDRTPGQTEGHRPGPRAHHGEGEEHRWPHQRQALAATLPCRGKLRLGPLAPSCRRRGQDRSPPAAPHVSTLALLAECFELLGGVPGVLLTDRMGCLVGGVSANVVVPAPGYAAQGRPRSTRSVTAVVILRV